jgi:hypothetical protein
MKKRGIQLLLLSILGGWGLTGCTSPHGVWVRQPSIPAYRGGEILVTEPPRQPRREIIGTPPDAGHIWVEGYWTHSSRKWIWIPGHWQVTPRRGAA